MQLPKSTSRFAIEARVGGGAMGDVYRAVDQQTGGKVAIKLLRRGAGRDGGARFRREIEILRDLRHPDVVDYVDHGTWGDGRKYLAMEWLEGEDLQVRLRRAPLGMADAVQVVRRASAALAAVHARGVVHRDLKMSNIWLCAGPSLKVKLIDFGVVKLPEPDGYETMPGAIIGTPQHMAPEQARGGKVTPRTDVYALGSVLFRLVTGRLVFPTEHIVALLGQLVLEDPPLASSIRFDVPQTLDWLLAACLSRNIDERPPDAGELSRALARVGPLPSEPPGEENSSSLVRRVAAAQVEAEHAPAPLLAERSSAAHPIGPGTGERRVVATVVAALDEAGLPPAVEAELRLLLVEGDRLEQVQGQRLLLAFGARQSDGDELLRAGRAALLVARLVPNARVAIASGQATKKSRGISADALERAAVQLDEAAVGGVRVDGATVPLLSGRFVLREDAIGSLLLHEDAEAAGTRRLLGRPTPTVGREKEISLLLAIYQEAVEERAARGAIVVSNEGLGKSRIRYELRKRALLLPNPPEILLCRGDPMTARGGLSCFGRALRAQMGVQDGEPAASQEAKVRRYVERRRSLGLASPHVAEFLGEIVGVHFGDEKIEPLRAARQSPVLMQSGTRGALETLLRADDRRSPQIMLLEDLHWADEVTLDLVDWMLGSSGLRFTVFGFSRPLPAGRTAIWAGKSVTRLEVAPLSLSASDKLVQSALPDASPEVRRLLAERAGGNALFLEELIRHAAEGRDELPMTVQALIQHRLDRLGREVRLVARAASVFGRSCWSEGVAALLGRSVDDELEALATEEFLSPADSSRISGQREWTFRHGLVRDAIYASLLDEDAATFHAKAALWLEVAGEEDFATLARHAAAGGARTRASALYARATAQAFTTGHMDAVYSLAERGLECATDDALRARLLVAKTGAASWLGQYDVALGCAAEALSVGKPGSADWAEAARLAGSAHRDQGRQAESEACLGRALAPEFRAGYTRSTLSSLLAEQARTLADLGRAAEARRAAEQAMAEAAEANDDQRELARLRAADARFFVIAMQGELAEQTDACLTVIDLADAASDVPLGTRARCNLGHSYNSVGLFERARATLERAAADARTIRMRPLEGFALHNLGMSLARAGAYEASLESQRAARRLAEEMSHRRLRTAALQYEALALSWRREGADLSSALALAREAESEARDQPSQRRTAVRVVAYVQLCRGAFDAALELSSDISPTPGDEQVLEWDELVRLTRIEALLGIGDDDEADALLDAACRIVQARARALSNPDQRAGYLGRLAENRRLLHLGSTRLALDTLL